MKSKPFFKNLCGKSLALAGLAAFSLPVGAFAGGAFAPVSLDSEPATQPSGSAQSTLSQWYNGDTIDGDWGGLRNTMVDHGVTIKGSYAGAVYSNVGGGTGTSHNPGQTTFDEQIKFKLNLDFEKIVGFKGLSFDMTVRYRDGDSPNIYAGSAGMFNPSNWQSGKVFRLLPFYFTWKSEDTLWTKDALTIRAGWMDPHDFFLNQPNAGFFINNAINSSRGIGGNVPWTSSFSAWGGIVKVKPVSWSYLMVGAFAPNRNSASTQNHGLPGQSGAKSLRANAELGFTPKLGSSKLAGKYAVGVDYYGFDNTGYNGKFYDNQLNYYVSVDQMLFREPSAEVSTTSYSKDGKSVVSRAPGKLSDQGLYFTGAMNFAKSENNLYPFYFQAGLVYKGLIPTRDHDKLGVMFAYGQFSSDLAAAQTRAGQSIHQNNTSVLEVDYQFQINKWAFVKPFYQWIRRPNGTGLVQDDHIIGAEFGFKF